MTDEEAFRELLFSNAQDDLKPLEIGLHVLKAVGHGKAGRGKKGGIREYARQMGANEQTMMDWVRAGAVAKLYGHPYNLLDYTASLSERRKRCPKNPNENGPIGRRSSASGLWNR
jgi:hypothetical protein